MLYHLLVWLIIGGARAYTKSNNPHEPNLVAISGALITLSLSILILNSQCEEGARDGIDIWYMGIIIVIFLGRLKQPRPMAVHIFQAYIHPKTKNTNYWCETASLKLREMLLNKTFQVQIDSKENHNPDVGCPQYKCKVFFCVGDTNLT